MHTGVRKKTALVIAILFSLLVECQYGPIQPTSTPSLSPTTTVGSPAPSVVPSLPGPVETAAPTSTPPIIQATTPPTVEPTLQPPSPTLPPPVTMWEGTVIIDTYGWEQALVPAAPDDPIYPYPRLDFGAVTGPAPRTYQAVFLQNELVQLVVLPELGGRILRWTDRTTGRQLLYANPVVKPTHWGYRGWWLATGGMEWAFPTEEHGLNEYRPWTYELLWDGVRVWDTDDRTGMAVEVTVQLEAGSSRVAISPHITNPTSQDQPYQFWANAMLTLSDDNAPSPDLTFVLPAMEVTVHSSGDDSLPGPGGVIVWPTHGGRDFSRYPEWHSYLGVFAPQAAQTGFAGAYDLGTDQGIARVAPAWVQGVKLFCLGDLGSDLWTDDGSRYFELWTGLTSTFWDYATLQSGESVGWTEYWYALNGIGGYTWANAEGAVRLTPSGDGVEVAAQTVRLVQAIIILRQGGTEAARWEAILGPGQPFRTTWAPGGGPWELEILDAQGTSLVRSNP